MSNAYFKYLPSSDLFPPFRRSSFFQGLEQAKLNDESTAAGRGANPM